ncbi:MAG: GH32 C-terminal domain-containing protein, partial [Leifsonia sp.]
VDDNTSGWGHINADQFMVSDSPQLTRLQNYNWVDWGRDFYAANTFNNVSSGERVMIGWMNNWDYGNDIPTTPWRSAMSLPRDVQLKTVEGQPRLVVNPVPQVDALALSGQAYTAGPSAIPASTTALPSSANGDVVRIDATISQGTAKQFGLVVRRSNDDSEGTSIVYDTTTGKLAVDRRSSGAVGFNPSFPSVDAAPVSRANGQVHLQIYLDKSSVEVFAQNGIRAITDQVFPGDSSSGIALYAAGGTAQLDSLTVTPLQDAMWGGSQSISFGALPDHAFGDADFPVSATATSGLPVTFTGTGACTVANGLIHLTSAGTCTVTASQGGSGTFNAAPPVTQTFTVTTGAQTIAFAAVPDHTLGDADFAVSATASSGLPVTFTANGSCTVTGAQVHLGGAGNCSITANQSGNGNYAAATAITQQFGIAKGAQTITFTALADHTFGAPDFAVAATASSGLPVTYTATGSCTVSDGVVHLTGAGSCTVTAHQVGGNDYAAAADAAQTFGVAQASQVVTFAPLPDRMVGDTDFAVSGTASSGLPVAYTASESCSAAGDLIHLTGAGTCSVTAAQTVSFGALADHTLGDADFAVTATADSGLPVGFTGSGACSVTAGSVHLTQAGTCTITATQAGNQNYNEATSVAEAFTVAPGVAVVSAPAASSAWGKAATVTVTVSSAVAAVSGQVHLTEGSTDRGTTTLTSGQARFTLPVGLSAGVHSLTATYLGNSNLASSSSTVTVTVVLPAAWNRAPAYAIGSVVSFNGLVYTAAWATKAEAPGGNVYGAWQQIAMTEDGKTVWTASRIFQAGDQVVYNGKVFQAAWYSRNDTPGAVSGPWQEIASAPDGTAIWTPTRIFNAGDVALWNGHKYTAHWYNRNQAPGTPNAPWTLTT